MEHYLLQLILSYKYAVLVPIAFLEGHIISLIVGVVAKMGYINPFLGGACIVSGNLIGDVLLYWVGYTKGERVLQKWGAYVHIDNASYEKVKHLFHTHKEYVLFISKITNGFGLAMTVLFTAGAVRIPFGTYMFWNVLGECVWTGALVAIGYFFSQAFMTVDNVIGRVGIVVLGICVLLVLFVYLKKYVRTKIKL